MDGTLLDTLDDLTDAMNYMLESLGYPTRSREYNRGAVGKGILEYVKKCLPEDVRGDAELLTRAAKMMGDRYVDNWNAKTHPYAGMEELLGFLKTHGVRLAVLTNKVDEAARAMVDNWFAAYGFDPVYGEREGKPHKPDPTVALEIAAELGLAPEECAFIGDSRFDMQTAKNAGMYGVGAAWGYGDVEELVQHGARFVAHTASEITKHLEPLLAQ